MKIRLTKCFDALLAVFFLSCTPIAPNDTVSTGGTGSEVVGVVNSPDTTESLKKSADFSLLLPLAGGNVFIHPESYYAADDKVEDVPVTYTETNGHFRIRNVLPGEHVVYIRDNNGNAIAHKVSVPQRDTVIDIGVIQAKKTAHAQIQYQGVKSGNVLFYISVRGTGITAGCTGRNIYAHLDKIPTGLDSYTVTIRMVEPFSGGKDIKIPKLSPDQIFTIDPFGDF